jgi:hypothetical protein
LQWGVKHAQFGKLKGTTDLMVHLALQGAIHTPKFETGHTTAHSVHVLGASINSSAESMHVRHVMHPPVQRQHQLSCPSSSSENTPKKEKKKKRDKRTAVA